MSTKSPNHRTVRFGVFEVDLDTGELHRNGSKVKLQEQPYQVLAALLERPGRLVTREEICERLWPDGTFIEFDRSLNIAVNKLRDALGDSAENPRFVETVPRRGYRFIAPVEGAGDRGRTGKLAAATLAALVVIAVGIAVWLLIQEEPKGPALPVPLTSYPGQELHPSLSPDGTQVAFSWNGPAQDNFDIYINLIGPGEPIRLTTDTRQDFSPVWSPDGRYIAFQRVLGPERAGVFLIPALGGPERQVTEGYGRVRGVIPNRVSIAWSPDNKHLVVTDRSSPEDPATLFLVDIDTGVKKPLTNPAPQGQGDSGPVMSPDGRAVTFVRGGQLVESDLYVQRLEDNFVPTGEPVRLTSGMLVATPPVWTADGEILFSAASQAYGPQRLWRVAASGSGTPRPVDSAGSDVAFPALSVERNRLVYTRGPRVINVWSITVPGPGGRPSTPEKLIASTLADQWPQFSPDGTQIAFQSGRSGVHEIWTCDRDGANLKQLTTFGRGMSGSPRWSPDQKQIAFDSTAEGQRHVDIWVMDADGGNRRRLTDHPARDIVPSWSRDGSWIYFSSNRGDRNQVWKVRPAGGEPIQVTQGGGLAAFESRDGRYLLFTRRAAFSGGLWRMPVNGGEETQVLSSVVNRSFAVGSDGVFFVSSPERPSASRIRYLDFSSGVISTVAEVSGAITAGLSVSPDSRQIIYSQVDYEDYDLMMVENFR